MGLALRTLEAGPIRFYRKNRVFLNAKLTAITALFLAALAAATWSIGFGRISLFAAALAGFLSIVERVKAKPLSVTTKRFISHEHSVLLSEIELVKASGPGVFNRGKFDARIELTIGVDDFSFDEEPIDFLAAFREAGVRVVNE